MKLRQLYNEIKLVPSNCILLQRDEDGNYYFNVEDKKFLIHKYEIKYNHIRRSLSQRTYDLLFNYFTKKHIKFKSEPDDDGGLIRIDAKYFIIPDKINEIKLVKATKNPYLNKLLIHPNWVEIFKHHLEYDFLEQNKNFENSFSFFTKDRWGLNSKEWEGISKEQVYEIIKYYKDKVNTYNWGDLPIPYYNINTKLPL